MVAVVTETHSIRPTRTAKGKANANLKEPKLTTKLRRESVKKEIKTERISTAVSVSNDDKGKENIETSNIPAKKITKQNSKEIKEATKKNSSKRKTDESIEPTNDNNVETSSSCTSSSSSSATNKKVKVSLVLFSPFLLHN